MHYKGTENNYDCNRAKNLSIKMTNCNAFSSMRLELPAPKELFCTLVNQSKGFTLMNRQMGGL